MVKKIAHACVQCPDLAEAKAFFGDLLEMATAFEFRKGDELFGYYFNAGEGTYIEVFKGLAEQEGPIRHICLETDDIESTRTALIAKGAECTAVKLGSDRSYQFWIDGPGNLRIEFHQYTPESYQLVGGVCQVNW